MEMTTASINEQFGVAMRAAGLTPPAVIEADGKLRRFSTNGKPGDDAGWYVLHGDGIPAGCFGDWRTGTRHPWRADIGRPLTPAEEAAHRSKNDAMMRDREAAERRRHAVAAKKAAKIWKAAQPACDDHPYLTRKGVKAHSVRLYEGDLVIPLRNGSDLHSLQRISENGEKQFLPGGRKVGCYFVIGNPKGAAVICIAEGYATGATIHEATSYPVVMAFDAGNLEAVARSLRTKFPAVEIVICADDDLATDGNPGMTKARTTAIVVGAKLAIPDFGADRPEGLSDFNDMMALHGPEAVARAIAEAKAIHSPPPEVVYRRLSDVQAKPIRWLWPGRIACGKLTMIAGNPGLGKSQLTAGLAAIVSRGGLWPVENIRCESGAVVILSAEDDIEDTIRPRLEAAGAELQSCYTLDAVCDVDETGKPYQRAFSLKRDLERLSKLLDELKNVRLVVVDPVSAYLGDADSHKNAEIRALLAPLGDLAAKHGVAVVAVSHFNKSGQQDALLRVMGSLAFVAAARAAYAVVKDQKDPERKLFLPLKNNLARDMIGYAFTVETVLLADNIESSRVLWEQEAVTITVEQAMASLDGAEERTEFEDAKMFLETLLVDGSVSSKQIRADADGAGYSWATIRRAQKALGIVPAKEGMRGSWAWKLPPKVLNNAEDAHSKTMSTFRENEHLQENEAGWEDLR